MGTCFTGIQEQNFNSGIQGQNFTQARCPTSMTCREAGFSMKAKSAWAPAKAVSAISGVVTGGFAEASSQASDPPSGQIQSKPCSTYTHMPLFRASARLRYMHTSMSP